MHCFLYAWQHFARNFSCCSFPFLFFQYFGSIKTLIYIWLYLVYIFTDLLTPFYTAVFIHWICAACIWNFFRNWTEIMALRSKNFDFKSKMINTKKKSNKLIQIGKKTDNTRCESPIFYIFFIFLVLNEKIWHCKETKTKITYIYIYNSYWSTPRKK